MLIFIIIPSDGGGDGVWWWCGAGHRRRRRLCGRTEPIGQSGIPQHHNTLVEKHWHAEHNRTEV